MPDRHPSTRRPLHPSPPGTSVKLHPGVPPPAGNTFKFAHLSRGLSGTLGSRAVTLSMMNHVGNLTKDAIAPKVS
jgi:hypothetical protein